MGEHFCWRNSWAVGEKKESFKPRAFFLPWLSPSAQEEIKKKLNQNRINTSQRWNSSRRDCRANILPSEENRRWTIVHRSQDRRVWECKEGSDLSYLSPCEPSSCLLYVFIPHISHLLIRVRKSTSTTGSYLYALSQGSLPILSRLHHPRIRKATSLWWFDVPKRGSECPKLGSTPSLGIQLSSKYL